MYERTRFGGLRLGDLVVVNVRHSTYLGMQGRITRIIESDGEGTIFVRLPTGSVLPFGFSEIVPAYAFVDHD